MPRDISRQRDQVGSSKKVAPKVQDTEVQKAIEAIYKELNEINLSVSKTPISSESAPNEGKPGDIRLYTKTAKDGSLGYFVQGKFGDSWASGRLGLQLIDPELPVNINQASVNSYVDDGGEYITKLGVTFENLEFNNDVGSSQNQVARGNHIHTTYENHINNTTIHFTTADIPTTATVSNTASVGTATTAARSDHVHKLNTTVPYTWTAKQTISVNSGDALDITGDVKITGDLTVDYAATGDGNGNANIDGNVVLNQVDSGQDYSDTYTTRINGKLTAYNETVIQHNDNQLSLRHGADASKKFDINVNSNALTTLSVSNNQGISVSASSVFPSSNLSTDLGLITNKWRTIHAGELVVENLVAQDVMATIGGRIMVAPTSQLIADVAPGTAGETQTIDSHFDVKHNNFCEVDDILFLQTAPNGVAQYEAVKVKSGPAIVTGGYRWLCTRNIDGSGPGVGNSWLEDDAIVNLGHNAGDGFIDITSTSGIYSSSGPHISMHARSSNNSNWQVPEVMRIGNLKGTWFTANNKYGLMLGKNLNNQPSATSNPFEGLLGTKDGLELYNSPIETYDGANLIAYVGPDKRTGITGAQFALGDNLTFTNDTTSGSKLRFEKNASSGSYELVIDQGAINVTVNANDITTAMPWLDASVDSNNNAGFYVTGNYLGFYQGTGTTTDAWKVLLGNINSNPYFRLGDTSTGPSLEYDGTNLNLKNLDITLDTNTVDVHIGEMVSDQGNNSYDDVIIGSWLSQTNNAPTNKGILVKHGANDYSQMGLTGFNRRGYDYPVHIYQGLHWGLLWQNGQDGTEVNAANTLNNVGGASQYGTFPHAIKNMKVGYWLTNSSHANYPTTVPSGRKLLIQINKIAGCEFGYWGNSLYCRPLMPTAYDINFSQDTGNSVAHNHSYSAVSNYLEDAMLLHTDSWNLGQNNFYHTGSSTTANSLRYAIANGLNNGKVFMYEIPENTTNLQELKLLSCGSNAVNGVEQRNVCTVTLTEVSM